MELLSLDNILVLIISLLFLYHLYIYLLIKVKFGKNFITVPKLDRIPIYQYILWIIFFFVFYIVFTNSKGEDIIPTFFILYFVISLIFKSIILGGKWSNEQAIMYYNDKIVFIYPTKFNHLSLKFILIDWYDILAFSYTIYPFTRFTGKKKEKVIGRLELKPGKEIYFKVQKKYLNGFIDVFTNQGKYNG